MAPSDKSENSCSFTLGQIKYFLHKKVTREKEMPQNEDHVEFKVEDMRKEVTRLKNGGFVLENEPKEYYWGISAYLRDPEGRFIELVQK